MPDLLFIDTETTGIDPEDEIWEFWGLRRFADGGERVLARGDDGSLPLWVGAVPSFDASRVEAMLRGLMPGWTPSWDYHLVDVEALMLGLARRTWRPCADAVALECPVSAGRASSLVRTGTPPRPTPVWAMAIWDRLL